MSENVQQKPKMSIDEIDSLATALVNSDAPLDVRARAMRNLAIDLSLHVQQFKSDHAIVLAKTLGIVRHIAKQNDAIFKAVRSAPSAATETPAQDEPVEPPLDVAAVPPGAVIPPIPGVPSGAPVPAMSVSTKVVSGPQS